MHNHSKHYKVLSLTGGGYRGYYTVSVLSALEELGQFKIRDKCDLYAGTSIGGIIALGLAAGLTSEKIKQGFKNNGTNIFPNSFRRNWLNLIWCKYNSKNLKQAIINILGTGVCGLKISKLSRPVLVTSICLEDGETCLISSVDPKYNEWNVLDAALATSAAPTYFSSHQVKGSTYVDGGLSCNVPDIAVLSFILDKLKKDIDAIQMLSIGTLHNTHKTTSYKNTRKSAGVLVWGKRLTDVIIDSQRNIILNQCKQLLPVERYLRIDRQIEHAPDLDVVNESLQSDFAEYAKCDAREAYKKAFLKSFIH